MKKLIATLSCILLLSSYGIIGYAKSTNLSKNISFDGTLVNGTPSGYGVLSIYNNIKGLSEVYKISGYFDGDKIKNASLEGYSILFFGLYDKEGRNISEIKKENKLEGQFSYKLSEDIENKKISILHLTLDTVNICGIDNVNVGQIHFNVRKEKSIFMTNAILEAGWLYVAYPRHEFDNEVSYFYKDINIPYLSYFKASTTNNGLITVYNDVPSNGQWTENCFFFKGGGKLRLQYNNRGDYQFMFTNEQKDTVNYIRNNQWCYLTDFSVKDSEGNNYIYRKDASSTVSGNYKPYIGENKLKLTIQYADGSKYSGCVKTDFLVKNKVEVELEPSLYHTIKSFNKKSIKYYEGVFTDILGNETKYIKGITEEEKLAKEKAKNDSIQKANEIREQEEKLAKQEEYEELVRKYGKQYADAINNGKVLVGMTKEMLFEMGYNWRLYSDSGRSKIYIGSYDAFAEAILNAMGKSSVVYVTIVNNKVTRVTYQ